MRIHVCTWNAGQILYEKQHKFDVAALFPGSPADGDQDDDGRAIYAIGLQYGSLLRFLPSLSECRETVPLALSLVGTTVAQLGWLEDKLRQGVQAHAKKSTPTGKPFEFCWLRWDAVFTPLTRQADLVRKAVLSGIALFVFASQELEQQIDNIQASSAGCGPLFLSNKGAVAVRLQLKNGVSFTFLAAHLAAHDYNVARRNLDWQILVSQIAFIDPATRSKILQIYDCSYLFVCGDLNYRISLEKPEPLSLASLDAKMNTNHLSLLKHDQLTQERATGRTLHGLAEGDIAFKPSYKFKVGSSTYKSFAKRTPSWCDRILYAASSPAPLHLLEYNANFTLRLSDHRPVAARFRLDEAIKDQVSHLSEKAPYSLDSLYWFKRLIGRSLDKIVGSIWYCVYRVGFKDERIGLLLIILGLVTVKLGSRMDLHLEGLLNWLAQSAGMKDD